MKIKKSIWLIPILACAIFLTYSFTKTKESTTYKCMIQMKNYNGEKAYVVISLLNPKGEYEKTLYVQGNDDEWYFDITSWWDFQGKKRASLDGITGATIGGGERKISIISIDNDKIDKGYKIRFETAVEDQEYYKNDVEFELTAAAIKGKIEGKGFIRYVRMLPQ